MLTELLAFLLDLFHFLLILAYMSCLSWSTLWIIHQIYIIDLRNCIYFTVYHFIDLCGLLFLSLIYLAIVMLIIQLICFFIEEPTRLKDY